METIKRFKTPFIISIAILTLLTTIILLRNLEPTSSNNTILLTINLCLFTLLFLIFFIVRSLYKIYGQSSGGSFERRLTIAFVRFIFIPSILLFILSSLLITYTVDKWFKLEFQTPIKYSWKMSKVFYDREKENALKYAKCIAEAEGSTYEEKLRDILSKNKFLNNPTTIYKLYETDGTSLVNSAFYGFSGYTTTSTPAGDLIRAATPITDKKGVKGVIVVETILDRNLVEKIKAIDDAYVNYKRLKGQQNSIRLLYLLVLAIATLIIIYMSTWISVRLSKSITVPIKRLVDAANTVANGNMNVRIDPGNRNDEIGILLNSFNT
ncbi:MAG: HAMP domain-containing protein, partial [Nitrospirae bacterium]